VEQKKVLIPMSSSVDFGTVPPPPPPPPPPPIQ